VAAVAVPAVAVPAGGTPGRAEPAVAAWRAPTAAVQSVAAPRVLCTITDRRIGESSGLVAAGDRLYTVNDGGERLTVFVLDRACRVRRTITGRVNPYDVEDLARSDDGTLWLSDTGDNDRSRDTVALELLTAAGHATLFRFRYPDGPHDAEALLVDADRRPYLVTKEPLRSGVYTPARAPRPDRVTPLRKVASLSFPPTGTPGGPAGSASQVVVTGGAVAAGGDRVALRTYTDAYVWEAPGGDIAAAIRSGRPRRIALPATGQGEAIAFTPDGRSLLTATEGLPAPVHVVPLPPAGSAPDAGEETPPATAAGSDGAGSNGAGSDGADSGEGNSLLANAAVAAVIAAALMWLGGRLRRAVRRKP
jgi:hypothetical protein